jgi:hypothetical protein
LLDFKLSAFAVSARLIITALVLVPDTVSDII